MAKPKQQEMVKPSVHTQAGRKRASAATAHLDPVIMTVIANRLDGIVREMTNTLLRAARSAVISSARDFSCCILTGDNQLLASAEGLPVHIFGAHLQGENMCKYHAGDIREGDAYLDNDPYGGNTHPGRPHLPGAGVHRGRAPVHDGRQVPHGRHRQLHPVELFRQGARRLRGRRAGVSRRAHPAQFQERAGHHPHVPRAHPRAGAMVRRLARRARLGAHRRAPAQGAVREIRQARPSRPSSGTGSTIPSGGWSKSIRKLPKARIENTGQSDPLEGILPDGLTLKVIIDIDPKKAMIDVDLRDNPPCVRLRAQHLARGGHQLGRRCDLQQPGQGHPAQCRLVPPAVVPICREQRGGRAGVPAQLLDRDHQCLRAARQHHAVGVRQARRRPRPRRRRHRARRRHGGALGQGPPAQRRALRQPHDALDQRRPGEPDRRRLGELRDPGDRRPDVPRQRRDRRAEASVPGRVARHRHRISAGAGRYPRRAGAGADLYGAGKSGAGRDPVRRPVRAAARRQRRPQRHARARPI